jgi:hypothetical protein
MASYRVLNRVYVGRVTDVYPGVFRDSLELSLVFMSWDTLGGEGVLPKNFRYNSRGL